ncbi:MAG: glycosyltransferase [Solirubrobacterales bacterium]
MALDVLIVSLGSTSGLRTADEELRDSLTRAGADVELVSAAPPAEVRTLMLTDLRWALAARRAASAALARTPARAVIYSSTTAALLWPRPGAIRFDAPAAGNRPGRHGLWQRPLERLRLRRAPLLLPWSEGALAELPGLGSTGLGRALVLPVPVEPSAPPRSSGEREIAAITYAANPAKKGLDRVLEAWCRVRRDGEELVVAGADPRDLARARLALPEQGVRVTGMLPSDDYRALLRRTRVFVCAPRREDYGVAQLEALADGCQLVSAPAPGPYVALPLARELDARLVSDDLGVALRAALDEPAADYRDCALVLLESFRREAADRVVAEELLPRLLAGASGPAPSGPVPESL